MEKTIWEKIGNGTEEIGKAIVPKTFRSGLRFYLSKAGIHTSPYKLFGVALYIILSIVFLLYTGLDIYDSVKNLQPLMVGLLVFLFWIVSASILTLVTMGAIYFYLDLKIFARVKEMDLQLADYLVLVSTNIKGGLSFEKSLWLAIKPEFGVLSEEMGLVSKKVLTGSGLKEALREFSEKYNSPSIRRTVDLIIGQLESGGEISSVLDETISTLRKTKMLKEEMSANTLMFSIFIGVIVTVISPLLFALALNLLSILIGVSATIAPVMSVSSNMPFSSISKINIEIIDFKTFSVLALAIISFFSSLILSIVQNGNIKSGVKYIPLFMVVSITLYFFFVSLLGSVFSFI